ncbi:hypothetical protein C6990_03425 [Nitrosopumilus sp. b3]|uniref:5'-nucleotidase C-terminal domain-containing protein n=1 Tax=Nitrosopumilus sp. b3 TaxID=2109909 RepID=UPI0015F52515|nr:5'-nucleotidase C-terminal domain-containing protein [Nitrosopumilus sp. b3]KAF6247519.1 hypothetical protein C6990_03425 [Nitrosopumilus sp. b3]
MDRILKKITSKSKNSLVIVHITDTYFLKESKIGNKIDLPGFARIYGVLELLSKKFGEENILFLHGGDFLFPSFLSNHYKGKQMIDILNQCRLDYCTLGNHDYDGGSMILEKRIHESKFKYLITNLIPPKNISKKILQYDVWPKKNPQIAIVGISGKMTATKAAENGFKIKDMKKSLHSTLNEIKKKFPEINLLAVLSHMGDSEDVDLKKNLNNMWSGNSIVFGGHDHSQIISYRPKSDKCMIVKGQSNARTIQMMVFDETPISKKKQNLKKKLYVLHSKQYQEIPASRNIENNIESLYSKLKKQNKLPSNKIIKKFPHKVILDGTELSLRKGTTNLGNFITDCLKYHTNADIALINSGHFRGDRLFLEKLRMSDLYHTFVMTDAGKIIVTNLSKKECILLLKHAYRQTGKGKILQFSKNTLQILKKSKNEEGFRVALIQDMLFTNEDGFASIIAKNRKTNIQDLRKKLKKDILKNTNLVEGIVKTASQVKYDPKMRLKVKPKISWK